MVCEFLLGVFSEMKISAAWPLPSPPLPEICFVFACMSHVSETFTSCANLSFTNCNREFCVGLCKLTHTCTAAFQLKPPNLHVPPFNSNAFVISFDYLLCAHIFSCDFA